MDKNRLYWVLQISGWSTYAALQVSVRYVYASLGFEQTLFLISEALLSLLLTHCFRLIVKKFYWAKKVPMKKTVPMVLGSSLVLGLSLYFSRLLVSIPLGLFDSASGFATSNIIGLSLVFSLIFFIWLLLYFSYHYFAHYHGSLKNEATMKDIALNNLKSQLNPHFIFNGLNSIRALVDDDPEKAKQAITQLSGILRTSLKTDEKKLISLDEELKTVQDYLALEKIRYEDRLIVEFDVHGDTLNALVPPLLIQTLVENGIKHGISMRKNGGLLSVRTKTEKNTLIIYIRNSGSYMPDGDKKEKSGNGLRNSKKRLQLIYGNRASLEIANEKEGVVLATLRLPKEDSKAVLL